MVKATTLKSGLNRQTTVSLGLLSLILSPLIATVIFIAIMSSKLSTVDTSLKTVIIEQKAHASLVNRETLNLINRRILKLEEGLRKHQEKKIYKLPHPGGAEAEFDKIYAELKAFKILIEYKARDRWTSADDKLFMMEFAQLNKLKMFNHTRVSGD